MPPGVQLCDSAPQMRKQIGAVALSVNLLLTTLVVWAMARESLFYPPQQKYQVTTELPGRPATLGIPSRPRVAILDASAPQAKFQVTVEPYLGSPRDLGIPSAALVVRDAIQAPYQSKYQVQADQFQNTLTLGVALTFQARGTISTVFQGKFDVSADWPVNTAPLGVANVSPAWFDFDAVPALRSQNVADQFVNTLPLTSAPPPPALLAREAFVTNFVPKYAVTVELPVRATGLPIPIPAAPPLPLGLEFQYTQLQTKYAVENDFYANILILGIPAPAPPQPSAAASAEPGRKLGRTRLTRIRQESEAEKLERRIEQGILPKPANVEKLERDIARYQAKITEYRAKALALERAAAADTQAKHLRAQVEQLTAQQEKAEREIEEAEILDLMHIIAKL